MSNDTPRDWEELKKLAEAATPGPWEHESKKYNETIYTPRRSGPSISVSQGAGSLNSPIWGTPDMAKADAKFIAAFNPATVLELIAEVEQAKRELYELHGLDEMMTEIRQACKDAMGGNTTFIDDDVARTISQLKAERDRMAEALGVCKVAMQDFGSACSRHCVLETMDPWFSEEIEVAEKALERTALNTGEKTDG